MTAKEFLSPEELAGYLGIPLRSIYAWNYQGTGPRFVRVGRHTRYRLSDVEKWLESKASTAQSA